MENLLFNFVGGKVRKETHEGREYFVAPLSLIVPGVLNGSKGRLYYPLEEIGANHQHWHGTPIVVYHPTRNGQNVSARHPGVLADSGIGEVRHPSIATGKLAAEGWFDIEYTKRVDMRVYNALEKGDPMELSTGLFTDNEETPGISPNGHNYDAIARNYRADHLAILPDQRGACSVDDGCGLNVNCSTVKPCDKCAAKSKPQEKPADNAVPASAMPPGGISEPESKTGKPKKPKAAAAYDSAEVHSRVEQATPTPVANASEGDWITISGTHVLVKDGKIVSGPKALKELGGKKGGSLFDVKSDKKKKKNEELKDGGKSKNSLFDLPSETNNQLRGETMSRAEMLEKLVANSVWKDKKEVLDKFADNELLELVGQQVVANTVKESGIAYNELPPALAKAQAAKKKGKTPPMAEEEEEEEDEPTGNAIKTPTLNEWISTMPPEAQTVWNDAIEVVGREKKNLVARLVANVSAAEKEAVSAEFLKKDIKDLRLIAKTLPATRKQPVSNTSSENELLFPTFAQFIGAAVPDGQTPANNVEDPAKDLLDIPTINWGEEVKA